MENFKFIAGQASSINQYKNTRSKLLKCCANIYSNKQCLAKKIIPNYAKLKFHNTSPAAQLTSKNAQSTRIKDEIKFLFVKKDKLNRELYEHHLKAAKWVGMWHIIQNFINEKLNYNMEKKYKILDSKINKLTLSQNEQHDNKIQFYPRVVNNMNIDFCDEEITLLNKGLKYNLPCNSKY